MFKNVSFCGYGTNEACFPLVSSVFPTSPSRPQFSLILALFLHPISYFPLPECVLCSARAGCLPVVYAVWLAMKHAELQWACIKCISVSLFEVINCCLYIPETRKSACGVVYTVKKLHKIEEEETVPACKKAKTQAWASCQQEPPCSLYPVAESSSTLQLAWFLTYWFFLAWRRIIFLISKWGILWESYCWASGQGQEEITPPCPRSFGISELVQ